MKLEYNELILYLKSFREREKEVFKEKIALIYLHNRICNTEKPPTIEEIYNDIETEYQGKQKEEQKPVDMYNTIKQLNAKFGGHMPK